MFNFSCLLPGFSKGPSAPAPLPAPVTREDPGIAAAAERLRLSEKRRKGRRSSILTGNAGVESGTSVVKRSAALGGTGGVL